MMEGGRGRKAALYLYCSLNGDRIRRLWRQRRLHSLPHPPLAFNALLSTQDDVGKPCDSRWFFKKWTWWRLPPSQPRSPKKSSDVSPKFPLRFELRRLKARKQSFNYMIYLCFPFACFYDDIWPCEGCGRSRRTCPEHVAPPRMTSLWAYREHSKLDWKEKIENHSSMFLSFAMMLLYAKNLLVGHFGILVSTCSQNVITVIGSCPQTRDVTCS